VTLYSLAFIGIERISSSEDEVSSEFSEDQSPPGSPPPEDGRCEY